MSTALYTAVIPAYNGARTLKTAVRSVLAQTAQSFELVIVDDGSTDETPEVAESLTRDSRVRVVSQPNRGLAAARNAGVAHASTPLIAFLDDDDAWMPNYLEALGSALERRPDAGFAYTDGWAFDDIRKRVRRTTTMARQRPPENPPRDPNEFLIELVQRNFIPAEAMVRRRVLETVGSFDESLGAVEDYELWLRLLAHGHGAARPPGLHLLRRHHPDSMSKDEALMLRSLREVWRLVVEEHPATPDVKEIARRRMAWAERQLEVVGGHAPARALARRVRLLAGRAHRRVFDRGLWYQTPPREVTEAFGDLRDL